MHVNNIPTEYGQTAGNGNLKMQKYKDCIANRKDE